MREPGFRKLSPCPIHPKADLRKREEFRSDFKGKAEAVLPEGTDPLPKFSICFFEGLADPIPCPAKKNIACRETN